MFKCILKRQHDWQYIPAPTNPDWGKQVPGKVCLVCGKVKLSESQKVIKTREEKARELYNVYLQKEHATEATRHSYISPMPPGPYDEYLPPQTPEDV